MYVLFGRRKLKMITFDAKTFKCCGKEFLYYEGTDKLEAPPDDKWMKIIHACDRLFAARINLTCYYVKAPKAESVPVI
jgi:hypothetical protein